jgi:hypothetical protein
VTNVDISLVSHNLFRIAGHVLRGSSEKRIEAHLLSGASTIRTVTVRADGAFELTHVPPGRHWLWARALTDHGAEAAWMTLELASDTTGLVIAMLPTAEVRGRVVTSDGTQFPGGGYQVIAHLVDTDGTKIDALPRDRADIGGDGSFRLGGLFGNRSIALSGNEWDVARVLTGRTVAGTLTFNGGERLDDVLVVVKKR